MTRIKRAQRKKVVTDNEKGQLETKKFRVCFNDWDGNGYCGKENKWREGVRERMCVSEAIAGYPCFCNQ